jgi:hypothetical protein
MSVGNLPPLLAGNDERIPLGELGRFKGITVDIFWFDTDHHNVPHIHAEYGEYKASVSLSGDILTGGFPAKQLRELRAWLVLYEDELQIAWDKAAKGENPGKIG